MSANQDKTLASVLLCVCLLLAGCDGFFVKPTGGGNGSTTGTTGSFAYVSNSASGPTFLAEYNLAAGTLAPVSGSPLDLGFVPVALAVAPNNAFLYAASSTGASTPGIYLYSIGSDGALKVANGGSPLVSDGVASLAISPDGGWLFSLNVTGLVMYEYKVNTSTGALTLATSLITPGLGCGLSAGTSTPASQTCAVAAAPGGAYVATALGTAGTAIFPFSSTAGISSAGYTLIPSGTTASSPTGDFSVALDKNNYVYITRTSTLAVYALTSTGATLQATATFANGTVPRSPLLSSNYNYVFTANLGVGTLSGFGIGSSGGLGEVSTSPFSAPPNVAALGLDNTGKYVVSAGYAATSGVQLYTGQATGALLPAASASSGTTITYPAVLALTH